MDSLEIAQIIDDLANESTNWFSLSENIKRRIESQDSILINYFSAFRYILVNKENQEFYGQFGPLGPIITFENGGAFPVPVQFIEEEVLNAWDELLVLSEDSLIRSRLADLLWIRKWKDNKAYLFAQVAIDSYCEISIGRLEDTDVPDALVRALDIAVEINDQTRKGKIIDEIVSLWLKSKRKTQHPPKMSLSLLAILMSLPRNEIPNKTIEFVEDLLSLYENDPFILETLLTYKMRFVTQKEKGKLVEKRIQIWIDEADENSKTGFIRHANLLHALGLARDAGRHEKINEIIVKIQETPPDTLDFHEISIDLKIPDESVEHLFKPFRISSNWEEGFTYFASNLPPSGNYENNKMEVNRQLKQPPLTFHVQNIVYDKNNLPIIQSTSIEESKKIALIRNETMMISGLVIFIPSIFNILVKKHGVPSSEEVIKYFTTPLIANDLAEVINESIQYYFSREYKLSSLLLIPIIESVIRETVRKLGLAIYRGPYGLNPSTLYGLGYLIDQLKGRMDESWRRYLRNVLTDPLSFNLRNEICHGRIINPGVDEASLLIHIICYLRLLQINHSDNEENNNNRP